MVAVWADWAMVVVGETVGTLGLAVGDDQEAVVRQVMAAAAGMGLVRVAEGVAERAEAAAWAGWATSEMAEGKGMAERAVGMVDKGTASLAMGRARTEAAATQGEGAVLEVRVAEAKGAEVTASACERHSRCNLLRRSTCCSRCPHRRRRKGCRC